MLAVPNRARQRWLADRLPSSRVNATSVRLSGRNFLRCGSIWMGEARHFIARRPLESVTCLLWTPWVLANRFHLPKNLVIMSSPCR
jgi:hypothetical protein